MKQIKSKGHAYSIVSNFQEMLSNNPSFNYTLTHSYANDGNRSVQIPLSDLEEGLPLFNAIRNACESVYNSFKKEDLSQINKRGENRGFRCGTLGCKTFFQVCFLTDLVGVVNFDCCLVSSEEDFYLRVYSSPEGNFLINNETDISS